MQILILVLAIGIVLHDQEGLGPPTVSLEGLWPWLGLAVAAPLLLAAGYGLLCRLTLRRMQRGAGVRAIRLLDHITIAYRLLAAGLYLTILATGGLVMLRQTLGMQRWILVDELLVMAPTLALVAWSWLAYFPIDRRLRQTSVLSRLDAGLPVHPVLSLRQYTVLQLRHQVALLGAPLLVLMIWHEVVRLYVPDRAVGMGLTAQNLMLLGGSAVVFLLAPVMLRHIWDTAPLPPGDLRERLMEMCRHYKIGVRELLLWRTFGGMINAAVMGLVAPLRYILLTDGLLETMPARQVEAVMAHELAHIRKRHMAWLIVAALACFQVLSLFWHGLFTLALQQQDTASVAAIAGLGFDLRRWLNDPGTMELAVIIASGLSWIEVFGWMSRRFERQADTFAVQHLARQRLKENDDVKGLLFNSSPSPEEVGRGVTSAINPGQGEIPAKLEDEHGRAWTRKAELVTQPRIDAGSVLTMVQALQAVADLNNIRTHRRSWRHGSIAWRQQYLRELVGQRLDAQRIDRLMIALNFGCLAALVGGIWVESWMVG
ncbi:MAG: M48 family metallopeptidase [Phycisphaeraceae bacterium]